MKTRIIAIVFGILISATAFAQRGGGSPEERAEKFTAHLTEKLSLSEDQATEVNKIFLKNMQKGREKAEQTSTPEDRRAVMKEQQAVIEDELKAVFSEEQFQEYLVVKEDMRHRQAKRRGKSSSKR